MLYRAQRLAPMQAWLAQKRERGRKPAEQQACRNAAISTKNFMPAKRLAIDFALQA
jgi:hypothetical protein